MGVSAVIKNGQIVESASAESLKKNAASGKSSMDKEAFLQLLVAQMKYQDPLAPTSNTEYVAQYAQFSQVEQMQNMAKAVDLQRAGGLVGQTVTVRSVSSSGESQDIQGKVDYVSYENGKAYVSVKGSLYSADDVAGLMDQDYLKSVEKEI